jgi:hypothetical protein
MALGLTESLTENNSRSLPDIKARAAEKLTSNCEPIV